MASARKVRVRRNPRTEYEIARADAITELLKPSNIVWSITMAPNGQTITVSQTLATAAAAQLLMRPVDFSATSEYLVEDRGSVIAIMKVDPPEDEILAAAQATAAIK